MSKFPNLLVIEDDPVNALVIRRSFSRQKLGIEIYEARDGIEALEMLRGTNGKEKLEGEVLILLDLCMPRMNGGDFLREIRSDEDLMGLDVFVVTHSDSYLDRENCMNHGVIGFINKDSAGEDYIRLIQQVNEFHRNNILRE